MNAKKTIYFEILLNLHIKHLKRIKKNILDLLTAKYIGILNY
jgi:hypothetical protein